jgi:pimeloyl-ACP methyl ester carboxylesterase
VAARFALEQPKSVDRLMLVNAPIEPEAINARLRTSGVPDLSLWIYAGLQNGDVYRREADKADLDSLRAGLDGVGVEKLSRLTNDLRIPSLSVHCENDPAVEGRPPSPSLESAGSVHQVTLETGGHHPMLREPVVFSRLVTDFLSLKSGESPGSLRLKDEWKRRFR